MKNKEPIDPNLNGGEKLFVTGGDTRLSSFAVKYAGRISASLQNRQAIGRKSFLLMVQNAVQSKAMKIVQGEQLEMGELNEPFAQRTLDYNRDTTLTDEEIEELTKQAGGHWESAR